MKITHYSILFLALTFGANAFSNQTETTDNYAYGAELIIYDNESIFSRVELDKNVYTQTVSSQLYDVRIFNRNGQTVPFALANIYDKTQQRQQFDMVIYPIEQSDAKIESYSGKQNYAVSIQGQDIKISVNQPTNSQDKYVTTYLLKVPSKNKLIDPLTNLQLQFAKQQDNWQATANVSYSSDLRYWNNVINNVPLMTLTNNEEQTLTLNDISFQSRSYYKEDNWLITLYSQKPIPELTKVIASSENTFIKNSLYPIEFSIDSTNEHTAIYSLPSAQPVNTLSVELNNTRTVLPVSIFYKSSSESDKWIKLEDKIFRKNDYYDEPTKISFDNRLVQQIKFETINTSFETAPNLIAYRNKVSVIFNSANNAPFILAWGAAEPKSASLNLSQLLASNESVSTLPEALIGQSVKLAGDNALKPNTNEPSSFPRWIIWLGLIIGAGALVLLAVKLAKEIKKQ